MLGAALVVAVAANMLPVLESLRADFKLETGAELTLVAGSSGKFAAQIREGAPFDVFVSADADGPAALHREGLTDGAPTLYARGALVLWTTQDLDVGRGLALTREAARVAVPDPRTAPYGRAAVAALEAAGLFEAARPKLVYGESVAQASQFIASGAADLGLTAKSVVLAPANRGVGRWADVDPRLYKPIDQSLATLKAGRADPALRRRFARFMTSEKARARLRAAGYTLPDSD